MEHSIGWVKAALRGAAVAGLLWTAMGDIQAAHAAPALLSDPDIIADAAEKVTPSVVNITARAAASESPYAGDPFFDDFFGRRRPEGVVGGSGVIVSPKGYVLTNNHVVESGKDIMVSLSDGREIAASVVGTDPKADLAVLKLKGNFGKLKPIEIGDSGKLRLGEIVLAIGNPFGVGQTVTMGIISAKGRQNLGIVDIEDFIQTDAAINPGNSGGALVNLKGQLIGINTAILSKTGGYQGIGLAIPTNMARPIMDSLIAKGKVVRGWLGVSIDPKEKVRGVKVQMVVNGSPAAKAGIKAGDVLLRVGDRTTDDIGHLRNAVAANEVGKSVAVEFVRGGKHQTANVVLTEQPENAERLAEQSGGLRQGGTPVKLGIRVAPLDKSLRARLEVPREVTGGVVVTGVQRGGAGEAMGLREGDVIIQLNGSAIKSAKQLDDEYKKARSKLAVRLYRDGSVVSIVLTK